jgi:hypothetical protein
VAALVLPARATRAHVVAAHVGERIGRPIAPVLYAAAFGRSRVLQLPRSLRLEAARRGSGTDRRARGVALHGRLAAPCRCRMPAPVAGVPTAALPGATLPCAALPRTALTRTALPRTARTTLTRTALPGTALPGTRLPGAGLPCSALPGTALPGTALAAAALRGASALAAIGGGAATRGRSANPSG